MSTWSEFLATRVASAEDGRLTLAKDTVACFGDCDREYAALVHGVALVDRSYRAMLEIRGADRASWLHNLTTNQVKTLASGDGHYAFSLTIKGRILFDLYLLVRPESIWLDLDQQFLSTAQAHCSKYTIAEDVKRIDRSADRVRLSLVGAKVPGLFSALGASNIANLPMYGSAEVQLATATCLAFRTDFCGVLAIELSVPSERAVDVWEMFQDFSHPEPIVEVGDDAVQRRRIEAGLPWPGHEITDEYLPAETGQFEQAVATNKGCYLGQEVVERMRSREALAHRLVGLKLALDQLPPRPSSLIEGEKTIGTLTSACRCQATGGVLGLGYVKSACAVPGKELIATWDGGQSSATVVEFPMPSTPMDP